MADLPLDLPQIAPLQVGEVVGGKYQVIREIGAGAMGVIYVARHLALGRSVAIKVLRQEFVKDQDLAARFEQEARAASAIGHPHIVDVFDLGRTPTGGLFMVMELLDGRSLAGVLEDEGALAPRRALDLMVQVLAALGAAHKSGIVHRDLKPENIFVIETEDRPSFVKLLDFGISKVLGGMHTTKPPEGGERALLRGTQVGTVMGTPQYMSPEQARGQIDLVDHRTDLWAAGVVLYEALVGRPPFRGDNYNAVISAILDGVYEPAIELVDGLSPAVDAVIEHALARLREQRWDSARAMREALVAASEGQSDVGARAVDSVVRSLPLPPSRPVTPLPAMDSGAMPAAPVLPPSAAGKGVRPNAALDATVRRDGPSTAQRAVVDAAMAALAEPSLADSDAPPPRPAVSRAVREPPVRSQALTLTPDRPLELAETPGSARAARQAQASATAAARRHDGARGGRTKLVVAAVVLLGGGGAGAMMMLRHHGGATSAAGGTARVQTLTQDAQVKLDGVAWDGKPVRGAHVAVVSAPGYVSRSVKLDGHDVAVRLAHALVPIAPNDPPAGPAERSAAGAAPSDVPDDQVDAALRKIDGLRACLGAKPDASACVNGVVAAPPEIRALDAAARELVKGGRAADDNLRRELRRYRTIWELQEAANLAHTAGDSLAWKTRSYALAAQAFLRAAGSDPVDDGVTQARADVADRAWERLVLDDKGVNALPGGAKFLAAARRVHQASQSWIGHGRPSAASVDAWNELVAAFDAMTTD